MTMKLPVIATVASHSSLQIFHGAKKEGFKTLGICIGEPPKFYDAYPLAKPDEFFVLDSYLDLLKPETAQRLKEKNVVLIPHGSFVEYMGAENFAKLELPVYGNKKVLEWESIREKEREWLTSAGCRMPKFIESAEEMDRPVIVKYDGAKGGRGFVILKTKEEFKKFESENKDKRYIAQEFVLGTRFYFHYFYSPIKDDGYKLSTGTLEMLGIDRRVESGIDEVFRLGSIDDLMKSGIDPGFTVTGNIPLVLRESLLPRVFKLGEDVVEKSLELFGGLWGPFCLETIITPDLDIVVFEISARIVAGTNVSIPGSPYSEFIQPELSTGRRIAQEIKNAFKKKELGRILS